MRKNFFGLLAGLICGQVAVMGAQALNAYHPDPSLKACWTQATDATVPDLAAANAMKVRIQYNQQTPVDVQQICTGAGPFQCTSQTPVPMSLQTVGSSLNIVVQAANVDPVDGSVTGYSTLVSNTVSFTAAPAPPTPGSGSNLRLVKTIAIAIAAVALAIYHFFI